MKPADAPHEVVFARALRWREAQEQAVWLAQQADCHGYFTNGKRWVADQEVAYWRFSDPNTAFRFRLQFS